ncbi:MAG: rhodanese-related sulfurtransferase [Rhodoferax sp.]|nr:rhodanese-related sulfurtransferase [Rhodoferax sp.]
MSHPAYLTAAFYKFVDLPDYAERKVPLLAFCERRSVKGMILLAREGINSTIAGMPDDVHAVLAYLRADPLLADLQHKESYSKKAPFYRMKVRLKKEIVTLQVPGISPTKMAGTYVKPEDWNALISDPDVVLVDTRNDYEVELGTFAGAIDPGIKSFAQLPAWVAQSERLGRSGKKTKVAMFCTGGIRCEKSTAYMREQGYDEVYHLEGGILKYLETIPPEDSLWRGECFVFDERVSVGHGLHPGQHRLCRACRVPLAENATESAWYERGVSCPRCYETTSEAQKASARERQKQWEFAKSKGISHIGQTQNVNTLGGRSAPAPERTGVHKLTSPAS